MTRLPVTQPMLLCYYATIKNKKKNNERFLRLFFLQLKFLSLSTTTLHYTTTSNSAISLSVSGYQHLTLPLIPKVGVVRTIGNAVVYIDDNVSKIEEMDGFRLVYLYVMY